MNHKQFWMMLAAYYRTSIPDEALQLYAQDVSHFSVSELQILFEQYRRDPKNKFMPLPAWFLEKKTPTLVDPREQAREVASRIQSAVAKFGWNNPEAAQNYIGSIGWAIAQRYGGWVRVCEGLGVEIDPGVFMAQTRDLAESMIKTQGNPNFDGPVNFLPGSKEYIDQKWDQFLDRRQKQLEPKSHLQPITGHHILASFQEKKRSD